MLHFTKLKSLELLAFLAVRAIQIRPSPPFFPQLLNHCFHTIDSQSVTHFVCAPSCSQSIQASIKQLEKKWQTKELCRTWGKMEEKRADEEPPGRRFTSCGVDCQWQSKRR
jgi:hypothetical protein